MRIQGLAATAADAPITRITFDRREPEPADIAIRIDYCGICHSDLHIARNDWHGTTYPIVLGHEIVGEVTAVGAGVSRFAVGDRVAVGCMVDSCRTCDPCGHGLEQYCASGFTATAGSSDKRGGITQGGFSTAIVVREEFVLRLPEGLDGAAAAPLLCAGITTYSALRHWRTGAGTKVGVIGLGGLGHIAVRLAKALGAQVTVITHTAGKEAEAKALGADTVILGTDSAAFAAAAVSLDLIINTVSAPMPLDPYLGLLRLDGTMVLLGGPAGSHDAPAAWMLESHRRSIAGSTVGGVAETQEMLDLCAQHGIGCEVEVIMPDQIDEAFERLERGDVRFRFVIDMRKLATS